VLAKVGDPGNQATNSIFLPPAPDLERIKGSFAEYFRRAAPQVKIEAR
jgi:hypothetical protein